MTESNAAAIAATRETPEAHRRALLWQVVDDYSLIGIFVVLFAVPSMTVQYFFLMGQRGRPGPAPCRRSAWSPAP